MWVFGYGSLLWNPGFRYSKKEIARLEGYKRSFSMRSIHHRGTAENPGLVLALSRDAQSFCEGLAFEVEQGKEVETLEYLRDRELVSSAYLEKNVLLNLKIEQSIKSLVYVIDEKHVQYCKLTLDEQAKVIAAANGGRGPNYEYLYSTRNKIAELGITDTDIEWLYTRVMSIKNQKDD
jgi:cation transport protein ChaC